MTVSWILREKGRTVTSLLPMTPLRDAVEQLAKHKIGAVVIADEKHKIHGIISERDVVRILAKDGTPALADPVSEHMTRPVMTCSENHTIDWVMAQMSQYRFRHMPVAENGTLTGIVSIGDVVKYKLAMAEAEAEQMRTYLTAG